MVLLSSCRSPFIKVLRSSPERSRHAASSDGYPRTHKPGPRLFRASVLAAHKLSGPNRAQAQHVLVAWSLDLMDTIVTAF